MQEGAHANQVSFTIAYANNFLRQCFSVRLELTNKARLVGNQTAMSFLAMSLQSRITGACCPMCIFGDFFFCMGARGLNSAHHVSDANTSLTEPSLQYNFSGYTCQVKILMVRQKPAFLRNL